MDKNIFLEQWPEDIRWTRITPDAIRKLIHCGSDVKLKDRKGQTPLHKAARWAENPEVIRVLIDAGAEVNARDYRGCTPFSGAYYNGARGCLIALKHAGGGVY